MQKVKEIVNLPVIKLKRETVIHNKVTLILAFLLNFNT